MRLFQSSLLVILLCFGGPLYAQQQSFPLANAGQDAIFVSLGVSIPFSIESPVKAYRVERRSGRGSDWNTIGEVTAPTTMKDFSENLTRVFDQLPHLSLPSEDFVARIWDAAARTRRLDSLGFWGTNPLVQISLGTMYIDEKASHGTEYEYRISEVRADAKLGRTMRSNPVRTPGVPFLEKFKAEHDASPTGTLRWSASGANLPAGMQVFRQENTRGDFESIAATAGFQQSGNIVTAVIEDKSTSPAIIVAYYVVPIDLFGNSGIPSDTIMVGRYDFALNAAATNISTHNMDSLSGIGISWRLSNADLVSAIQVHRADKWDGTYAMIAELHPSDTSFIDQTTEPMQEYFYRLVATGPLGEQSEPSARVYGLFQSSEPPLPPVEVFAVGIKNGVRVEWENADDHIDGYYVYRMGGGSDSLSLMTPLLPLRGDKLFFVDTSRGLSGKHVYGYAVRSENTSHVQSGFSDTAFARPLIPTEPLAPMEASVTLDRMTASMFWKDMTSVDESVDGYSVFRREIAVGKKPGKFRQLNDSLLTLNYYTDATLELGKQYEYAIQSIDAFGGKSTLTPTSVVSVDIPQPPSPQGVRTITTNSGITVKWDIPSTEGIKAFRLYRYERGKAATRLAELKTTTDEFIDSKALKGKLYFFYLTSVSSQGAESPASREAGARR